MDKHRVFKIPEKDNFIVFIPTLSKVYLVPNDKAGSIPDFVQNEKSNSFVDAASIPDYQFFGTNLILTNNCNLSCVYCYGSYGPSKHITMKKEIAFAAIDYISKCVKKAGRNLIYANMFGGEPTQAWDIMTSSLYYLREVAEKNEIRSRATISTNGCMEIDKAVWLAQNMDRIAISIDGYKDIQNIQRSNSFDKVFEVSKRIYEIAPQNLRFRSTISEYSVEHLPDIVEFLSSNFPKCHQAYEPLFTIGRGKQSVIGAPAYSLFFDKFLESLSIAEKYECKLRTSVLNLGGINTEFCGIAGRNFMITPDGRCTTCNRMSENTEKNNPFTYGYFNQDTNDWFFDDIAYQKMKKFSSKNISVCQDCFAFSSCRGDCIANKSIIAPNDYWQIESYRCEEVRNFTKKALLYILEKESAIT